MNDLQSNYNIKVKKYKEEGLIVLNYDQVFSPKNILTDECRGLILDLNYNLVSRAFDRFYNYGERNQDSLKSKFQVYEKIDGSLIKFISIKNGIFQPEERHLQNAKLVHIN